MIQLIRKVPKNVAAFRATGKVTEQDYKCVVVPEVDRLLQQTDKIHFLLQLDTELGNFTMGAWWQDLQLGLKNLTKWQRAAIVTDSKPIIAFTNKFGFLAPGEFRGFKKDALDDAIAWVSEAEQL